MSTQRKRGRPPKHLTSDEKNTALSTARKAYKQKQAQQRRVAQAPSGSADDAGGCDDTQDEIVVAGGEALEVYTFSSFYTRLSFNVFSLGTSFSVPRPLFIRQPWA